jgi:hypothetical protein
MIKKKMIVINKISNDKMTNYRNARNNKIIR